MQRPHRLAAPFFPIMTLALLSPATIAAHASGSSDGMPPFAPLSLAWSPQTPGDDIGTAQPHARAEAEAGAVETGTDPSKLILRFEMNPQYLDLPGEGSLLTTNFKLDIPLTRSCAVAIDAPLSAASGFSDPIEDQFGFADVAVRARNVWTSERSSVIVGAEAVLRTADDELLGSGKWQLNPSVAFVYHFSSEYLLATAWKQRLSIAGDDERPDLNASEFRLIGIYINPEGWWLQADYQPKINWENDGAVSHLLEFEAGAMITRSVGISVRPGVGIGANKERDWSIGIGLRFLF